MNVIATGTTHLLHSLFDSVMGVLRLDFRTSTLQQLQYNGTLYGEPGFMFLRSSFVQTLAMVNVNGEPASVKCD